MIFALPGVPYKPCVFPHSLCNRTARKKTNGFYGYLGGKFPAVTKGGISFLALFLYFS